MTTRETCVGCGQLAPETETDFTLISAKHGWRVTRYRSANGAAVLNWRCPGCWAEYKKSTDGGAPPAAGSRPRRD